MNAIIRTLAGLAALTLSTLAAAHSGHGEPGTALHDLQHQLWTFAALVAVGAVLAFLQTQDQDSD